MQNSNEETKQSAVHPKLLLAVLVVLGTFGLTLSLMPNDAGASSAFPSDTFQIQATGHNLCVDIPGNNAVAMQDLWLWECNQSEAQVFVYQNGRIINHASGLCLDVEGNGRAGADVQVADCVDASSRWNNAQAWSISGRDLAVPGDRCLDVAGGHDEVAAEKHIEVNHCGYDAKNFKVKSINGSTTPPPEEGIATDRQMNVRIGPSAKHFRVASLPAGAIKPKCAVVVDGTAWYRLSDWRWVSGKYSNNPSGDGFGTCQLSAPERFIREAAAELGYRETKNCKSGTNCNKFAPEVGHKQGREWCASFMRAMGVRAGVDIHNSFGSKEQFNNAGSKLKEPKVGALAWRPRGNSTWKGHIGVVAHVYNDGTFELLSGNSSNDVSYSTERLSEHAWRFRNL